VKSAYVVALVIARAKGRN